MDGSKANWEPSEPCGEGKGLETAGRARHWGTSPLAGGPGYSSGGDGPAEALSPIIGASEDGHVSEPLRPGRPSSQRPMREHL